MELGQVAELAEKGRSRREHSWVDGAMRGMAIAAVLAHRAVLPEERPAEIGMTAVTGLVAADFA